MAEVVGLLGILLPADNLIGFCISSGLSFSKIVSLKSAVLVLNILSGIHPKAVL